MCTWCCYRDPKARRHSALQVIPTMLCLISTELCRRYLRALRLRWPIRTATNGRPLDLLNIELKPALLAAGYAVVTIDVRGTGLLPLYYAVLHCLCAYATYATLCNTMLEADVQHDRPGARITPCAACHWFVFLHALSSEALSYGHGASGVPELVVLSHLRLRLLWSVSLS